MSIMSDRWIREQSQLHGMISPFVPECVREVEGQRVLSYGTSSYGYDARAANEFKVFTNEHGGILDPKQFDEKNYRHVQGDSVIIPPNSFILTRTVEWFKIPRGHTGIVMTKSTYARIGVLSLCTPLEAEWEGHITLEFANTTTLPARFYAGEGAVQILFLQGNEPCDVSYKDRGGKYQGQKGITDPRM